MNDNQGTLSDLERHVVELVLVTAKQTTEILKLKDEIVKLKEELLNYKYKLSDS